MSASNVWFRNDLRLADNPALIAALASSQPFKVFTPFWRACRALPPPGRVRWLRSRRSSEAPDPY